MYLSNSLSLVGLNVDIYLFPPLAFFDLEYSEIGDNFSLKFELFSYAWSKKGDPSQSWQIFHFIVISGTTPSHPNLPKTNQTPRAAFFSIHKGLNIFNLQFSVQQFSNKLLKPFELLPFY